MQSSRKQREHRQSMLLRVRVLSVHNGCQDAVVRNVSTHGLSLKLKRHCYRGEALEVELPGIGWIKGSVRWSNGGNLGLVLHEQIDIKYISRVPPDIITNDPAIPSMIPVYASAITSQAGNTWRPSLKVR
jgi:hypothetical protein